MSKLTIVNVTELWQALSQPHANILELLAPIDDMDMAGFQLIHRLVCDGRIALSQLNPSIAQTLTLMGCKTTAQAIPITIPTLELSEAKVTEPEAEVTEPEAEVTEPEVTEPEAEVTEPEVTEPEVTEPEAEVTEPEVEVTEPEVEVTEPEVEVTEPEVEVTEPEVEVTEPEAEVTEPEAMMPTHTPSPSPASSVVHDLSWKEIRNTIMTMNLAVAQIDLSMNEGEFSVETLIDSFNFMNSEIDRINTQLQRDEIDLDGVRQTLAQQSVDLTEKADASIVAFQFYDKLSQRLHHVSQSLSALTDIISCGDCVLDETNWDKFMERMSKYACMREESELFELIFERGYSASTAVGMIKEILSNRMQEAREKHKQDAPNFEDDIELF